MARKIKDVSDTSEFEFYTDEFGIKFTPRDFDSKDTHVIVELYTGDDGHYRFTDSFSSFWLMDLIKILIAAQSRLEQGNKFTKDGVWGFKFK